MLKWLDKVEKICKNDNSRLGMIMDILTDIFSERGGNNYVTVKCKGHNEKFIDLMNEFGIVFWIDVNGISIFFEKIDFCKKFSDKYPMVFSAILMKIICGYNWDILASIGYYPSSIKKETERVLLDSLLNSNGLLGKHSKSEVDDIYSIVNNINSNIMGEIISRKIKSLLSQYVDEKKGMICLSVERKFFKSEISINKYKEKLIGGGFSEITITEYDEIRLGNNIFKEPYIGRLINPGDEIDMVLSDESGLLIVKLLKMYPPIFSSMSCFRRAINVATRILFGTKKKSSSLTDIKFFSFEENSFHLVEKVPYVKRSMFNGIKSHLTRCLDLLFEYFDEYPFISERDWKFNFIFKLDKKEEIKIVLDRMKEDYVMQGSKVNYDKKIFIQDIINSEALLTFNMIKKISMMEYSESLIIYKKISHILWMNEELGIGIGGNIRKKISYALSRDDLDFRLDDIKYSLIESFCNEYTGINIVDAFDFFDNIYFEESTGIHGWSTNSDAKEKRDVISYMISKKDKDMREIFKNNSEKIYMEDMDKELSPYIINRLSNILYDMRLRTKVSFDWVGRIITNTSYRGAYYGIVFDSKTKTIMLDMRERFGMIEMHPFCEEWVDKGLVNKIYICTNYGYNFEDSSEFIYEPDDISKDKKVYEVYNKKDGFKYKKDICIYDSVNDDILYFEDGCEYAAKKNNKEVL